MKIFSRVLALTLVAIMLAFSLTACAKRVEDGEYILGDKGLTGCYDSFLFDGKHFSYTVYIQYNIKEDLSYEGTYKLELIVPEDEDQALEDEENGISRGNIILTWLDANGVEQTATKTIIIDEYKGTITVGDLVYTYYYND